MRVNYMKDIPKSMKIGGKKYKASGRPVTDILDAQESARIARSRGDSARVVTILIGTDEYYGHDVHQVYIRPKPKARKPKARTTSTPRQKKCIAACKR